MATEIGGTQLLPNGVAIERMEIRHVDYSLLPEHMRKGTRLWIEDGIMTGSFLTAVMENKFVQAFRRADEKNSDAMEEWVRFLWHEAPSDCWGSEENVARWRAARMGAPITAKVVTPADVRMKETS